MLHTRAVPFVVLLALAACKPQHASIQSPPSVDASDASDDAAHACAILAAAGCPVGSNPNCADAIRTDQAQGVGSQIDVPCILAAGPNRSALARCNVTCQ